MQKAIYPACSPSRFLPRAVDAEREECVSHHIDEILRDQIRPVQETERALEAKPTYCWNPSVLAAPKYSDQLARFLPIGSTQLTSEAQKKQKHRVLDFIN